MVVAIATILMLHSMDIRRNVIVGAIIVNSILTISGLKYVNWTLEKNKTSFNVLICTLTTMAILGMIFFVLWVSIVISHRNKYLQIMEVADRYLEFSIIIMFSTGFLAILLIISKLICSIKGKNGQ